MIKSEFQLFCARWPGRARPVICGYKGALNSIVTKRPLVSFGGIALGMSASVQIIVGGVLGDAARMPQSSFSLRSSRLHLTIASASRNAWRAGIWAIE